MSDNRIENLLNKAQEAARQGVACYNNPYSRFRAGGFLVHMHIAWNALCLAALIKNGECPYETEADGSPKLKDGREIYLDMIASASEYFGAGPGGGHPIVENLAFLKGLRDRIEHAEMPEIDAEIFGECQAMLLNFENAMKQEFGEGSSLAVTLAPAIQFSSVEAQQQLDALRKLHRDVASDIRTYVETFRSSLARSVLDDQRFSYKVFMLPVIGNHRTKDCLAVQFIHHNAEGDDEEGYNDAVAALLKLRTASVSNAGLVKPGVVVKKVSAAMKPTRFTTNMHTVATYFYKARPRRGRGDPAKTKTDWCVYDSLNKNYGYTDAWVQFLIAELSDARNYRKLEKAVSRFYTSKD